jgi:hypothetical protein
MNYSEGSRHICTDDLWLEYAPFSKIMDRMLQKGRVEKEIV